PGGDPSPRPAQGWPADPQGRTAVAFLQGRHADHGWRADPDRGDGVGAAVGRPAQQVRVGGAAGDAGLRRDRLVRRLDQDRQARSQRPEVALEVPAAVDLRTGRRPVPVPVRRRAGGDHVLRAAVQVGGVAAGEHRVRGHRLLLDRRLLQRGQPDRWPRWPGDHADRAGRVRAGIFAYASGHAEFSRYLQIPAVPGAGELVIICAAIAGAGLGFLWFNTYPAMVFMGDIGALALGAVLGTVAVIVRQELVLVIMGGLFVIETLSVMIQVASFKLTGKR